MEQDEERIAQLEKEVSLLKRITTLEKRNTALEERVVMLACTIASIKFPTETIPDLCHNIKQRQDQSMAFPHVSQLPFMNYESKQEITPETRRAVLETLKDNDNLHVISTDRFIDELAATACELILLLKDNPPAPWFVGKTCEQVLEVVPIDHPERQFFIDTLAALPAPLVPANA